MSQYTIQIRPEPSLLDEELEIQVTGLPVHCVITLVCRVEEDGVRYSATAYYQSDQNGVVNVRTMSALPGGSYHGVEPMGLIWSGKQEPGQREGRRLAKIDVTTPLVTRIYLLEGRVESGDCLQLINKHLYQAQSTCNRLHMAGGVERIVIHRGRLHGTMFIPPGSGPHPGVIDLFGTVGGTVEHRSALLASRGVASFTVQYFTPGHGDGLVTDLEYFEEAIDLLLAHPKVQKPYVGIVGVSKGGELALLIAALCHKVRACVEINGIPFVTLVHHTYKDELFLLYELDYGEIIYTKDGMIFTNLYYSITPEQHEKHGIPVERGLCDYLLVHSEDDQSMPPIAADVVPRRLEIHGKHNYQVVIYPGAGHILEPPHSPHFLATYHKMFGGVAMWGGTAQQHARAQEQAWTRILNFFKTTLFSANQLKNHL